MVNHTMVHPPCKSTVYILYYMNECIPGTQMTLVLDGKGFLLEGSDPKIGDKQVPVYTVYIYIHIWNSFIFLIRW